jgi:CRP-like cAMP-binding protein
MQRIKFFQDRDIKPQDFPDILQCLILEHYPKGAVIFNYGDMGDKFYIILSGQVRVMIPDPAIKSSRDQMNRVVEDIAVLEE